MFKLPTSTSRRVAVNTGILYAKIGITMFISLYTTRLILNSLGASDFGIFGIVGMAISMLGFLGSLMASATQRFISYAQGEGDTEKQKSIFNISVVLHFLIALVVVIVLLITGQLLFSGALNIPAERIFAARMIYYFMTAGFFFTILSVPYEAVLNAHENMLYYAIVGIFESVLKLTVAIIVVYTMFDKLIVYGALMAGISFTTMSIMWLYCRSNYGECVLRPKVYFNKKLMKEMTSFAGWSFLGNISSMILNLGWGLIINKFFGTKVNAAQGISGQINGQLGVFAATLMKALNPVIAKSEGAGNRMLMIRATMMGCKIPFFLLAFFCIPVLIEMPYILNIWLVNVPEYAIIFCRLQLIRSMIEQLFGAIATSIAVHGDIKKYEIVSSIFCYFPLVVSYFLFHVGFPPSSSYLAYIIFAVFASGISLFFAWSNYRFPVDVFFKKIVLRCIGTFTITYLSAFVLVVIFDENFFRLLMVITIGMGMFILSAWFVGFDKDERSQMSHISSPVLSKVFIRVFTNKNDVKNG